jgi:hypothetical protein
MKLIQSLLILTLATGFLASGIMTASAEQGSINDQHCTTSTPCQKICGNHVCAPGEVYSPVLSQTKTQNTTIPSVPVVPQESISHNKTIGNSTLQNLPSTPLFPSKILSPRAQEKSGVNPTDVKCVQGFSLVLNFADSRPACIKSEDLTKFIVRSWGKTVT